jgi:hypothetical protein
LVVNGGVDAYGLPLAGEPTASLACLRRHASGMCWAEARSCDARPRVDRPSDIDPEMEMTDVEGERRPKLGELTQTGLRSRDR